MIRLSNNTLVDLLRYRTEQHASQVLYEMLYCEDADQSRTTFAELDLSSKAIGSYLQQRVRVGERVLLLFQPGMAYIQAFMGCLYAGVIPVPAYPPDRRNVHRLMTIIEDAKAMVILSTSSIRNNLKNLLNQEAPDSNNIKFKAVQLLERLMWISTDEIHAQEADGWKDPNMKAHDVAFLQYTSGSTSNPKGVIVTHENLIQNSEMIKQAFQVSPDHQAISWLPPYHDMGLIGGILQPLYAGIKGIMMSPISFLKKPSRWMEAISEYGANGPVISGGPNFSYELCMRKVREEQLEQLDLSNWKVAFTGAEPVRPETLTRFSRRFEISGFDKKVFFPVYGLAEGTLLVSAGDPYGDYKTITVDKALIEKNKVATASLEAPQDARQFIGCGTSLPDHQIKIVNPETKTICETGEVGEIWIAGPSVAKGYWNKDAETFYAFYASTEDSQEGPFFRTGDFGFLMDGELFVTGRLKEIIIIRGRNYYPQDIEISVQESHPALRAGCGTAFSIEKDNTEHLVIVQEVDRNHVGKVIPEEVNMAIKYAVSQEHELQVSDIVLLFPSTFPKTSSGKLQRTKAKQMYLNNDLKVIPPQETEKETVIK